MAQSVRRSNCADYLSSSNSRQTKGEAMATGGGISRAGRNTRPTMPVAATDVAHPAPPEELTEEEAAIWQGIVTRMPPDYFAPPTWPMLVNLCRHIRLSHWFARQLRELEQQLPQANNEQRTQSLRDIMALSRAQSDASRTIAMLATRLRLTCLYDSSSINKARRAFLTERPWDIPNDDGELPPQ